MNALSKLEPNQLFLVVFYTNETYPMFFPDTTIELIPITFGSDGGAGIMRQIASKNGGEYRFIPDGP